MRIGLTKPTEPCDGSLVSFPLVGERWLHEKEPQEHKAKICVPATVIGFEPILSESKSGVLPLHHTAEYFRISRKNQSHLNHVRIPCQILRPVVTPLRESAESQAE